MPPSVRAVSRIAAITFALATLSGTRGHTARVIQGHVFDQGHHGVSGALVGMRVHETDAEVIPAVLVPASPWIPGYFVRADANGAFRVAIPTAWGTFADSALDVIVVAQDYAPYVSAVADSARSLDVTLTPSTWHTCTMTALKPDSQPAAGAVARAVLGAGDSVVVQATADPAGRISVRAPVTSPIALDLTVTAQGYRPVDISPRAFLDTSGTSLTIPMLPVVTGIIRDERGRPMPNVGALWDLNMGLIQTSADWKRHLTFGGVVSDSTGRYIMAPRVDFDPQARLVNGSAMLDPVERGLMFADSLFANTAVIKLPREVLQTPSVDIDVVLHPTREVRIPIVEPPRTPASGGMTVGVEATADVQGPVRDTAASARLRAAHVDYPDSSAGTVVKRREVVFHLPPGHYRTITYRGSDIRTVGAWFEITAEAGAVTLPAQRLHVLPIYAMLGKPAPDLIATTLDGTPVHLAAYRGKVVVLDFWAFWCGPCVDALKHSIVPFAEEEAEEGKPVVVLGMHDATVRNHAEFDSVFAQLKQVDFGGHNLPFPVFLDQSLPADRTLTFGNRKAGTGETTAAYNVFGFPSTFLIDARGVLVAKVDGQDEAHLRAVVDQLLREMTAAPRAGAGARR
jgi:thiol-disulfide isomerase/thioredoxin